MKRNEIQFELCYNGCWLAFYWVPLILLFVHFLLHEFLSVFLAVFELMPFSNTNNKSQAFEQSNYSKSHLFIRCMSSFYMWYKWPSELIDRIITYSFIRNSIEILFVSKNALITSWMIEERAHYFVIHHLAYNDLCNVFTHPLRNLSIKLRKLISTLEICSTKHVSLSNRLSFRVDEMT